MGYRRKLIEVALPLDGINAASAREKSIRHGHPSTLHLWWARRPLAACRAVLFASLVDDPSARPDRFPTEKAQIEERERLFGVIEELVLWENSNNPEVLDKARAEVAASCGGELPAVLDPFAGGGSIPLEAQRLGLEAHASDLNPVAVLINKALVEIPPLFAGQPPIHPDEDDSQIWNDAERWSGAEGLAADVRYYGQWMRDQAEARIGHLYPTIELPAEHGGGQATVIAWLWARTVPCRNPVCRATMPLLNSFALSRRKNREAWLEPVGQTVGSDVQFQVRQGPGCPKQGTVTRGGAVCLACGSAVPLKEVREAAQAGGLGSQLVCVVAEGDRQRVYLEADLTHVRAATVEPPSDPPSGNLPTNPRAVTTPNYGLTKWDDLFTPRQLTALCEFSDLIAEARRKVLADALTAGCSDDPTPLHEGGTGAVGYADAVAHYLGLSLGRLANRTSTQSFWHASRQTVEQVFARPALPMIWIYAEGNPFSDSSGNYLGQLVEAVERTPAVSQGHVKQLDARSLARSGLKAVVCTDPPYYDNIPYADLSDFFYVWLRRCLSDVHPDLFSTLMVPKAQEMIAEPARQGDWDSAAAYFEQGLREAFAAILEIHDDDYPFTIFYAFKQAETDEAGTASTGWETMLEGLLDAGVTITGTWPIRTEQPGGLREVGRAALASSIVLVCRRRPADAPLTSKRDFLTALSSELPEALRRLQQGNIAPVDLAQASIGPGMAIFSRYSRIVEADGTTMTVRDALTAINQALDVVFAEQEDDFDSDTRWAIAWYTEFGFTEGSAGMAETLSKAKNTSIGGLVKAGVLHQEGNSCRLLNRDELDGDWTPADDTRLTVWEVTQYLVRELFEGGELAAADLLRQVGGLAEPARELAYRLYHTCERKNWASDALAYNSLVTVYPELTRLATSPPTGQTSFDLTQRT